MCIIRNEMGKMIGRVNFFSIITDKIKRAELGYRIAKMKMGMDTQQKLFALLYLKDLEIINLVK